MIEAAVIEIKTIHGGRGDMYDLEGIGQWSSACTDSEFLELPSR